MEGGAGGTISGPLAPSGASPIAAAPNTFLGVCPLHSLPLTLNSANATPPSSRTSLYASPPGGMDGGAYGGLDAADVELAPAVTTVAFSPAPLPPLRVPVRAGPADSPERGAWVLAFQDESSWRSAWGACERKIAEQCEVGARMGCAVRASERCQAARPWGLRGAGGGFLGVMELLGVGGGAGRGSEEEEKEREACEEREMMACLATAQVAHHPMPRLPSSLRALLKCPLCIHLAPLLALMPPGPLPLPPPPLVAACEEHAQQQCSAAFSQALLARSLSAIPLPLLDRRAQRALLRSALHRRHAAAAAAAAGGRRGSADAGVVGARAGMGGVEVERSPGAKLAQQAVAAALAGAGRGAGEGGDGEWGEGEALSNVVSATGLPREGGGAAVAWRSGVSYLESPRGGAGEAGGMGSGGEGWEGGLVKPRAGRRKEVGIGGVKGGGDGREGGEKSVGTAGGSGSGSGSRQTAAGGPEGGSSNGGVLGGSTANGRVTRAGEGEVNGLLGAWERAARAVKSRVEMVTRTRGAGARS
ncbi:unnamed protein product [Closterium sp. NIES-65]|nr:unnamed protein product [Closterium sp. NIES-65]